MEGHIFFIDENSRKLVQKQKKEEAAREMLYEREWETADSEHGGSGTIAGQAFIMTASPPLRRHHNVSGNCVKRNLYTNYHLTTSNTVIPTLESNTITALRL